MVVVRGWDGVEERRGGRQGGKGREGVDGGEEGREGEKREEGEALVFCCNVSNGIGGWCV